MIAVRFYKDAEGRLSGFSVIGHSGALPHGEDIVCAAVSALAITTVNALDAVAGITICPFVKEGILHLRIPRRLTGMQRHDANRLLRTARLGMRQIAAQYPRYVRISEQEGNNDDFNESTAIRE